LSGLSGSGKSSISLGVARFVQPERGRISSNGLLISDWPEAALRKSVTLVSQHSTLKDGSIAQNLRLANPQADDASLWAALETVQLADLVRNRGGLQAQLGPRGAGVSGGEARRLVLARALLRHPAVLPLDEPTEGLDAPTADTVLQDPRTSRPETTIHIGVHRPEELAFAQTIIRLP
jgi:ATP-binding cassette subfamily C protein CydC